MTLFLGAIGTAVLAVFCITGLRHTGRPLQLPRPIWAAVACLFVATLLRTGVPLVWPQHYLVLSVGLPALLWLAAYGLYALCYAEMLCRACPDELPG